MSIILSMPVLTQAAYCWLRGPADAVKRWWVAYLIWRIEQATIAHLKSMSDRELKDIGLTRSEIVHAVRSEAWSRQFSR